MVKLLFTLSQIIHLCCQSYKQRHWLKRKTCNATCFKTIKTIVFLCFYYYLQQANQENNGETAQTKFASPNQNPDKSNTQKKKTVSAI